MLVSDPFKYLSSVSRKNCNYFVPNHFILWAFLACYSWLVVYMLMKKLGQINVCYYVLQQAQQKYNEYNYRKIWLNEPQNN